MASPTRSTPRTKPGTGRRGAPSGAPRFARTGAPAPTTRFGRTPTKAKAKPKAKGKGTGTGLSLPSFGRKAAKTGFMGKLMAKAPKPLLALGGLAAAGAAAKKARDRGKPAGEPDMTHPPTPGPTGTVDATPTPTNTGTGTGIPPAL